MNNRSVVHYMVVGLLLVLAAAPQVMSEEADNRDVVRDTGGHIISNTFGNCVRTEWTRDNAPCAPHMAKEHHIKSASELTKEERTVYFDFDRSGIKAEEQTKLDSLAEVLKADKEVKSVHIVGFADRIGSISYNKKLSEIRAKNVEHYLHNRDYLNTALAKVHWLGKSEAITHCPNKLKRETLIACLGKDRRVEVQIDYWKTR